MKLDLIYKRWEILYIISTTVKIVMYTSYHNFHSVFMPPTSTADEAEH